MSELYTPPRTTGNKISQDLLSKLMNVDDRNGFPNRLRFTDYLVNQNSFIEQCLHPGPEKVNLSLIKEDLLKFEHLYARLNISPVIQLNVLVVENKPDEHSFIKELRQLKEDFKNITFYLIRDHFDAFKASLLQGKRIISKGIIDSRTGAPYKECKDDVSLESFDLILQDIFLESGGLSGNDFAELYFNVAPQAMVFFLTSMDIETLAASGYDNKVDRLVGKDRIKGTMKYYYDRFHELYGPLLWPVFEDSKERENGASITDRASIRKLIGNIRTWTMAPKILFHGFALPEMIDHEFRHTAGLWKMANNILGPFLERMPDAMLFEDRVLLSLAIWLHDIGHRGDEHHFMPMEIRENHGAISESLILEHFETFGIGWLREFCTCFAHEPSSNCFGISHRNKKEGCAWKTELCALRKIGLICRYHQSQAPLAVNKLKELIPKLKMPSPYCVIRMESFSTELANDFDKQIKIWMNKTKDFGWFGTDIRTLDEFDGKDDLLKLTGMLRWLDALHTHSDKVGSALEVKSFLSYLEMRKKYCEKRINEIDNMLDKTIVGSEAYLSALAERFSLDKYSELLEVQGIHLWRSGLVKHIKGEWFWDERHGEWAYRILFELYETDPFENDDEIKAKICLDFIKEKMRIQNKKDMSEIARAWSGHVWEEVIESEINGQVDLDRPFFDHYFNGINIYYSYKTTGGDPDSMCEEK